MIRAQITNLFVQGNPGYDYISEPGVFGNEHRTPRSHDCQPNTSALRTKAPSISMAKPTSATSTSP
jgi:hypothetical protein